MNAQRVLDTFLESVGIYSPSWHESDMAAWCKARLEALGFTVAFDQSQQATESDTPQIIATLPATGAGRVAFSCHMDCVEPCADIKPQVEDGVIRSDGTTILSADDKAGIAQVLEGVQSVLETGEPHPEITVLLSVCEEQGAAGAPHFPETLFDPPVLTLVMDADGRPGSIVLTAPYHYTFSATFTGRAAHAGVEPEAGINAIAMASAAVSKMPLGRHDHETTSSVGTIEGGKATNIVAETCVLGGECRSIDEAKVLELRDRMDACMKQAADQAGGQVEVNWWLSYPGIRVEQDDPDVQLVAQAAQAAGLEVHYTSTGGGSDANVLWAKGCRAIPLGTGMTDFHSCQETVRVADLEGGACWVEEIILALARSS